MWDWMSGTRAPFFVSKITAIKCIGEMEIEKIKTIL